jgi:3-hydroxyisobutyrate dehydrogenase-like beta-hydroxyacid dehydrogenase
MGFIAMMTHARTRVGIVGLGAMGGPIANNILARGFPLVAYDINTAALDSIVASGARRAAGVADLASHADVVLVVVPTADDVNDVCGGPAGLLAAAGPGTVIALLSSLRPEVCRQLADQGRGRDVDVIDAPMTGGVRAAVEGSMMLVVGGPQEAVERARPVLDAVSASIHHLGAVGSGQVGKLINNLIHWGEVVVLTEALSLAAALGVRASTLRAALMDGPTDSRHLRELGLMKFTWFKKDLADVLSLADEIGREIPSAQFSQERMPDITPKRVAELLEDRGWELPPRT